MIFYIGDTHFGDWRVMELAHRPYVAVGEMDRDILYKWNSRVEKGDTVYILGDFAFNDEAARIIDRLHGKKVLIMGNHDQALSRKTLRKFARVETIYSILDNGRSVCLCHYPLLSYDRAVYGGYHVFGHIHNNKNDIAHSLQNQLVNSFHCGADVVGFMPRTLDELISLKKGETE